MSIAAETPSVVPCISICETVARTPDSQMLVDLLGATCYEAGLPGCARIYAGSYFCENFFLGIEDGLHETVRQLCAEHDMGATLVIPIIGQAFLERAERRIAFLIERFGDVYDEIVVNDIAQFHHVSQLTDARIGLGRLFSKEQRDMRYEDLMDRRATPVLSPEARECVEASLSVGEQAGGAALAHARPLVEVDPVSRIVDVSEIMREVPDAEIAIHLPYCYATTGRNCGPASVTEDTPRKFRIGRPCSMHCLRMVQGCTTDEGATFVKHGKAYYYPNPECQIAGTTSWRLVYSATHETMRASWPY